MRASLCVTRAARASGAGPAGPAGPAPRPPGQRVHLRSVGRQPVAPRRRLLGAAAGGTAPGPVQSPLLEELQAELKAAIKAEDYQRAARIRDRMRTDPVAQAEAELEAAIREERYADAAAVRDRLKDLRPPPRAPSPPPPPPLESLPFGRDVGEAAFDDSTATTASDTVTDGVRVTCRSFFVPQQSAPARGAFYFAYDIRIRNESDTTIKIMERHWHIVNGRGQAHEVRGAGVVGEQPELAPGEAFQYQSACPLPTPNGSMEGDYEVYAKDPASGQWRRSFLVKIGKFALRADVNM